MSTQKMSGAEMVQSLTGFDEIAIEQAFNKPLDQLANSNTMLARALVFVDLRREGRNDGQARKDAMGMSIREVLAYFPDDEDEVMPEEPVTEQGKEPSEAA